MNQHNYSHYSIGTMLNVKLNDAYFIHPTESFIGSEAVLFKEPRSNDSEWVRVTSIKAAYAGDRASTLKLRLETLQDMTGKKVLAVSSKQIEEISDIL